MSNLTAEQRRELVARARSSSSRNYYESRQEPEAELHTGSSFKLRLFIAFLIFAAVLFADYQKQTIAGKSMKDLCDAITETIEVEEVMKYLSP